MLVDYLHYLVLYPGPRVYMYSCVHVYVHTCYFRFSGVVFPVVHW
jgi:hypothetical protein